MGLRLWALALWGLAAQLGALQTLRLPWIFSDEPEITADFNFFSVPGPEGKTRVELALGGRFSKFGLPRGAARAPRLEIFCEFVSPGELVGRVAELKGTVDLGEVLEGYGAPFDRSAFSKKSPYVFKTELNVPLNPGDYNVVVAIRDKELSIASRRTLHVIVPAIRAADGFGDLKFCLGLGEKLDKAGRKERVLDPNPWRQVGGAAKWDLIVAYETLGLAARPGMTRRQSVWRLRGDNAAPVWSEEGPAPARSPGQLFVCQLGDKDLKKIPRGVYVFKVETWSPENPKKIHMASKTFEVLP